MSKYFLEQDKNSGTSEDEENDFRREGDVSQSMCIATRPKVSTPVSLLIESLIQNMVNIYETDTKKASVMYKVVCDKLFKMELIDESYKMGEFEGMRSEYQRAFFHLISSVKNGDVTIPPRPIWPNSELISHYLREFDEIEYIAGGGFGQVFKVKHKLDDTEYAVKKIAIHSEGIESVKHYLSEVKTFASMNHSNIVQYKAAWLEIGPPSINKAILHTEWDTTNSQRPNKFVEQSDYIYHREISDSFTDKKFNDSTDFEINFEHSASGVSIPSRSSSRKCRQKRHSVSEGDKAVSKLDLREIEKIRTNNRPKIKWATLYIQMALCQCTLKQWLETRNDVAQPDKAVVQMNSDIIRRNAIKQILIQVLRGLEYIHSKGIVHHDIKPSNIFIQKENGITLIQLGDFGLACPLQSVRHSLAFGTKLYAAPEQLAGKCDPKSDMYSVGIVLFELVENFKTDMERVENITELRKGRLPVSVASGEPEFAHVIEKLMRKKPELRPDTTALLHSLTASEENGKVELLKAQLAEKDEEIAHLKELLKSHGIKSV
ncbi:interferon-induced, double-stranded RNA-activated protein kinase-like [Cylas formicarius]|uniref:interferon-induced, double-stranded RNA-activated protein kinase-like n=1 Tax=Cylas formicarius TaxID=197179 RepID=UPI0029588CE2|nr:interferon-induced, double-stranded RNA-activated protein kinase-like [Cylas formicarius]XP_060518125.1 interferon-induced, double-stranded RNA-activated protein kinase-like [Cylas formicarius]XP_060518126.1 interferon-induced, double-stranded RNA-activated protein kinase-like [Cylas formicarius]